MQSNSSYRGRRTRTTAIFSASLRTKAPLWFLLSTFALGAFGCSENAPETTASELEYVDIEVDQLKATFTQEQLDRIRPEIVLTTPPRSAPDGFEFIAGVYALTPHGAQLSPPAKIAIQYEGSEEGLAVLRLPDERSAVWERVEGSVVAPGLVTFSIKSFSYYGLARSNKEECPESNACGGCDELENEPDSSCGVCGTFVCDGEEAVHCNDPGQNGCGGCADLDGEPDGSCGACGVLMCDGEDALRCDDPSQNGCGGCEDLEGEPESACGACGAFVCDGEEAVRCDDSGLNACGGCADLDGELDGSCGACGALVCDGEEALRCDDAGFNACDSCGDIENEELLDEPCGICRNGTWACADDGGVACEGAVDNCSPSCSVAEASIGLGDEGFAVDASNGTAHVMWVAPAKGFYRFAVLHPNAETDAVVQLRRADCEGAVEMERRGIDPHVAVCAGEVPRQTSVYANADAGDRFFVHVTLDSEIQPPESFELRVDHTIHAWPADGFVSHPELGPDYTVNTLDPGDLDGDGRSDYIFFAALETPFRYVEGVFYTYRGRSMERREGVLEQGFTWFAPPGWEALAPVELGVEGDVNNDGLADIKFDVPGSAFGYLLLGPIDAQTDFLNSDMIAASVLLRSNVLTFVGDMTGDGAEDAIRRISNGPGSGDLNIIPGPFFPDSDFTREGTLFIEDFPYYRVRRIPDINGDGLADLGVSSFPEFMLMQGLDPEGVNPFSEISTWRMNSGDSPLTSIRWASGDLNGDDIVDHIHQSLSPADRTYEGVSVFFGPLEGDVTPADADLFIEVQDSDFHWELWPTGDINNDGFMDMIWVHHIPGQTQMVMDFIPGPLTADTTLSGQFGRLWICDDFTLAPTVLQSIENNITVSHNDDVDGDGIHDVTIISPLLRTIHTFTGHDSFPVPRP